MHHLHVLLTTILFCTAHTLILPSLPFSQNLTFPHNTTTTRLTTTPWPPTPFKAFLRPEDDDSYLLFESVIPSAPDSTDYDEHICADIADIARRPFSGKGSETDVVKAAVRVRSGRVVFTLWPNRDADVAKEEVVMVLQQLWFGTSEWGAASVFGRLVVRGVERAEVGVLLRL